jgi:translation initiation factor 1
MAKDDEARLVYSTGDPSGKAPKPAPGPRPPSRGAARPSGGKGARLRLETRSGRVVTLVLGLVGTEAQLAEMARTLRAACSAGGAVREGVIELQGDQREKAQAALAAQGIKAQV